MNSSRSTPMCSRLGTFTIICTENIGAPVCAAAYERVDNSAMSTPRCEKNPDRPATMPV